MLKVRKLRMAVVEDAAKEAQVLGWRSSRMKLGAIAQTTGHRSAGQVGA